jgi:hypothetical protein
MTRFLITMVVILLSLLWLTRPAALRLGVKHIDTRPPASPSGPPPLVRR